MCSESCKKEAFVTCNVIEGKKTLLFLFSEQVEVMAIELKEVFMRKVFLLMAIVVMAVMTGCASHQAMQGGVPGEALSLNADDYEQRVKQANHAYDVGEHITALRQYDAILEDFPDGAENLCLLRTSMAMVSLFGLGDRALFIKHASEAKLSCEEVKYPPVNTQLVLATYQTTQNDFKRLHQVSNGMHQAVSSVMKGGD